MLLNTQFLLHWAVLLIRCAFSYSMETEDSRLVDRQTYPWLLPPSMDSWHVPLAGWEKQTPGDVLKLRHSAYPTILINHCIDTFQIQYRSSDTHGSPSWAVATVFIPATHVNCSSTNLDGCAHGVVSYQFPYDTAFPDACPSYFLQFGDPYRELADLLAQGWFVVVADYEGPTASYCSGPQAGYATLDAAKAVMKVAGDFGLRVDIAKYAIWGYSGGALSAAFAAEMAAEYAPSLRLAGVVYGGLTPNLTTSGEMLNRKEAAGLVIACLVGITNQYPDAYQFLIDQTKKSGPYNTTGFFQVTKLGAAQILRDYVFQNVFEYFNNSSDDYYNPLIQSVMRKDGYLGGIRGIPKMPVFVYKAVYDEMSPTEQTDALYDIYCASGANVLYHRNQLSNHTEEAFVARPRVFQYLRTILNGEKKLDIPAVGCRTVNLSEPFTGWNIPPIAVG